MYGADKVNVGKKSLLLSFSHTEITMLVAQRSTYIAQILELTWFLACIRFLNLAVVSE